MQTQKIDPGLVTIELTAHECDLIARALYAWSDCAKPEVRFSQIQALSSAFEISGILTSALSHLTPSDVERLQDELILI